MIEPAHHLLESKRMLEQIRAEIAEAAASDPRTVALLTQQALLLRELPETVGMVDRRNVSMLAGFAIVALLECTADVREAALMEAGEL